MTEIPRPEPLLVDGRPLADDYEVVLAHEHLLKVLTLLDRLEHQGDVPAPRAAEAVDRVFEELDTLLRRTTELGAHTASLLGELSRE